MYIYIHTHTLSRTNVHTRTASEHETEHHFDVDVAHVAGHLNAFLAALIVDLALLRVTEHLTHILISQSQKRPTIVSKETYYSTSYASLMPLNFSSASAIWERESREREREERVKREEGE
jgi:hypothetical protein